MLQICLTGLFFFLHLIFFNLKKTKRYSLPIEGVIVGNVTVTKDKGLTVSVHILICPLKESE